MLKTMDAGQFFYLLLIEESHRNIFLAFGQRKSTLATVNVVNNANHAKFLLM